MSVFIDSDVLVDVLRGEEKGLISMWRSLAASETAILYSPISAAEIWAAVRPQEHVQITKLFQPLLCIPVGQQIAKQAGEYLHKYGGNHQLTLVDALIAASAIRNQAALWTRNRSRYPIPELSFYD